jgi:hypothetical protein
MVMTTASPTPYEVVESLRGTNGIKDIHLISLK